MLSFLDNLRALEVTGLTFWSVILRMTVAILCGGFIGIERERKRRPAGFRTHILICLGAATTTMTSQYLFLNLGFYTDISRLGAQVIAGIGFIGAGTIIVTRQRQVKGLTTAAGLWTSAIVGLAAGAGYYEATIITTILIILAEVLFSKIEYSLLSKSNMMNIFVEYNNADALDSIIRVIKQNEIKILDLEITKNGAKTNSTSTAIFSLQAKRKTNHDEILATISNTDGILSMEEL